MASSGGLSRLKGKVLLVNPNQEVYATLVFAYYSAQESSTRRRLTKRDAVDSLA